MFDTLPALIVLCGRVGFLNLDQPYTELIFEKQLKKTENNEK